MKILNLKFMNIGSLKGEWEIAFDRPPLADTGLFAIVGPNGVGKTNILDALTLALYGETSRLRDPDEKIMSRLTAESFAVVTFTVGEDVYRSRWSIKRTSGKCGPPEMVLSRLNGGEKTLEDRTTTVQTRIAELTGLDFKRFCRSVLLPQGEFAAFLNALESERAEILERIIGAELGREQELSVRTAVEVENEKLRRLEETAADIPLLDEVQLNELRESIDRAKQKLQETARLIEVLKAREDWQERVSDLESAENEASGALAEAEVRYAESQSAFERLEWARKAIPFQGDFNAFQSLKTEADRIAGELDRVRTDIRSNRERIQELEDKLRRTDSDLEQAQLELEDRGETLQKAIGLDHEIIEEGERFRDHVARFEDLERKQKENLRQQSDVNGEITETNKKHDEAQRWLSEHVLDAGLGQAIPVIEDLLTRLREVRGQILDCRMRLSDARNLEQRTARKLKRAAREAARADRKAAKLTVRKTGRDMRMKELLGDDSPDSLAEKVRAKTSQIAFYNRLLKIAEKYRKEAGGEDIPATLELVQSEKDFAERSLALEQDILIRLEKKNEALRKYATDRSLLEPGGPCLLCGSTDHPYTIQPPDLDSSDRELSLQMDKVHSMKKEFESLSAKTARLQASAESIHGLEQEWMDMVGALLVDGALQTEEVGRWSISNIDFLQDEIRAGNSEIRQYKTRISSIRWQRWVSNFWGRALNRTMKKLSGKEQQREALGHEFEIRQQEAASLQQKTEEFRNTEQKIEEVLTGKLADCRMPPPEQWKETALVEGLKERNGAYMQRLQEESSLVKRMESLNELRAALVGEVEEKKERTAALASEVESMQRRLSELKEDREKLFGVMDPLLEKQRLEDRIASLDAERQSLGGQLESIRAPLQDDEAELPGLEDKAREAQDAALLAERKLIERVSGEGFMTINELENSCILLQDAGIIEEQWLNAERMLDEARTRFQAVEKARVSAVSEEVPGDPVEVVLSRIAEASESYKLAGAEVEAVEEKLRQQDEFDREHRNVLQAIIEQEAICKRVTAERDSLRANPAEAKSRLQKLMLERLIERSNIYLEMLSGRYHLREFAEERFGLRVEDSLQEKSCRPVKTLSGGESFVVSLCLALGLSDLASRNNEIGNLFIDEGFGSLDEETLYRVIVVLKGLQATGKMVGIISHIQRLAAEIPVRIKVENASGGFSRITMAA